jgi:hypothetical protein
VTPDPLDRLLVELHDEEKRQALTEFWASVDVFRAEDGQC